MSSTVTIEHRFRGPPHSANGGYTCGLVAAGIDGPAEVTLRSPPPLGIPMELRRREQRISMVGQDGTLVAEAEPTEIAIEPPEMVSVEDTRRAASHYPWRDDHPYPTCFVCGPERSPGDGLCIFPGPVAEREIYAAPWIPERSLADSLGVVRGEFVWAALDCPSGIVTDLFGEVGLILLGRLSADLRAPVMAGAPHVVQAWTLGREGRKLNTASALFSAAGDLCAVARAVWIEVSPR